MLCQHTAAGLTEVASSASTRVPGCWGQNRGSADRRNTGAAEPSLAGGDGYQAMR